MKTKWFYITLALCMIYSTAFVYMQFIHKEPYFSADRALFQTVDPYRAEQFTGCILTIDDTRIYDMICDSLRAGKKHFTVFSGKSAWPQRVRVTVISKKKRLEEHLYPDGSIKHSIMVREY